MQRGRRTMSESFEREGPARASREAGNKIIVAA